MIPMDATRANLSLQHIEEFLIDEWEEGQKPGTLRLHPVDVALLRNAHPTRVSPEGKPWEPTYLETDGGRLTIIRDSRMKVGIPIYERSKI